MIAIMVIMVIIGRSSSVGGCGGIIGYSSSSNSGGGGGGGSRKHNLSLHTPFLLSVFLLLRKALINPLKGKRRLLLFEDPVRTAQ